MCYISWYACISIYDIIHSFRYRLVKEKDTERARQKQQRPKTQGQKEHERALCRLRAKAYRYTSFLKRNYSLQQIFSSFLCMLKTCVPPPTSHPPTPSNQPFTLFQCSILLLLQTQTRLHFFVVAEFLYVVLLCKCDFCCCCCCIFSMWECLCSPRAVNVHYFVWIFYMPYVNLFIQTSWVLSKKKKKEKVYL